MNIIVKTVVLFRFAILAALKARKLLFMQEMLKILHN